MSGGKEVLYNRSHHLNNIFTRSKFLESYEKGGHVGVCTVTIIKDAIWNCQTSCDSLIYCGDACTSLWWQIMWRGCSAWFIATALWKKSCRETIVFSVIGRRWRRARTGRVFSLKSLIKGRGRPVNEVGEHLITSGGELEKVGRET